MQAIVIPDQQTFSKFIQGDEVLVAAICFPDHEPDLQEGRLVEVWLKSNTGNNPHYLGKIIQNLGYTETVPEQAPGVVKLVVGLSNAVDILPA